MNKKPMTALEIDGLLKHKLPIDKPSQLSDAFRAGMEFAVSQRKQQIINKDYASCYEVPVETSNDIIHWPLSND